MLDVTLETDPDRDLRPGKREATSSELDLVCSFSIFNNTVANFSVLCWIASLEQKKGIDGQISGIY